MDIISLISGVSKLAIGGFVIMLAVIAYEVYVIVKKRRDAAPSHEKDIDVPDFNNKTGGGKGEHNFTDIPDAQVQSAPKENTTRRISKNYLLIVGGLLILIAVFVGFFIYQRSQVAPVDVDDISPIADQPDEATPTQSISPSASPTASAVSPTESITATPTAELTVTEIPLTPTSSPSATLSPTESASDDDSKGGIEIIEATVTPTPTEFATSTPTASATSSATTEPTSSDLPQAGVHQTTLLIIAVSMGLIYLALIL